MNHAASSNTNTSRHASATFLYTIFKKPSEQYWSKLSMYIIDTRELTLTIKLSAMLMPLACYIMT